MKRTAFAAFSFVTFAYICIGAVVFHYIEGEHAKKEKKTFETYHLAFLDNHTCLSPEALRMYIIEVMEAHTRGVPVVTIATDTLNNSNSSSSNSNIDNSGDDSYEKDEAAALGTNWDLASAFLFCLTVVSTVGYGNIAPKTEGGQVFCMLFALIGIPLFATSLVGVGERLQIPLKKIKKAKPWCRLDPKKDEQIKTAVFLSSGILVLIFLPSYVLSRTEDWTFIESLYFCIITLTTIGFGDYVPAGNNTDKLSFYFHRCILSVWILLGLSWIALILSELASVLQEKIIEAAKRTSNKFGTFEDMVKKKAKDAREKIVQKVNTEMLTEWCEKNATNFKDTLEWIKEIDNKKLKAIFEKDKETEPVEDGIVMADSSSEEGSTHPSRHRDSPRYGINHPNGIQGVYRSRSDEGLASPPPQTPPPPSQPSPQPAAAAAAAAKPDVCYTNHIEDTAISRVDIV